MASSSPVDTEQRETRTPDANTSSSVPTTGRRLAFEDLKRQLADSDLANPGVQKLILEMLMGAESERDNLKLFVNSYYEADKRAAVLEVKLRGNVMNEVLVNVGIGVGCALLGLAPNFWKDGSGPICLAVGVVLIIGSAVARIFYK